MKKQDNNPIDNYFKENMEQDFPYAPSSWNKASKVINTYFGRRNALIFLGTFLLVAVGITMFVINNSSIPVEKSIVKSKTKVEIKKSPTHLFSKPKAEVNKAIITVYDEKVTTTDIPSSIKDNPAPADSEIEDNIAIIIDSLKNEDIEKENESPITIATVEEDLPPALRERETFTDLLLFSKPLTSFIFNAGNTPPSPVNPAFRKRKRFDCLLELETVFSLKSKQELSGLPQAETAYRNKYELLRNTNSYKINFMFQRGAFAVISGLGYQNTIVKTDYVISQVVNDIKVLYKTENKWISASSGDYLLISTRTDTLSSKTVETRVGEQSNRFEWLQVPLKVSYQYAPNRLRFSVRAGADFSWLYNTRGSFIHSDLNTMVLIGNGEQKLQRFNTNLTTQLFTGYQLNSKFQVGANLSLSKQLGSNFAKYNRRFEQAGFGMYVRMGL